LHGQNAFGNKTNKMEHWGQPQQQNYFRAMTVKYEYKQRNSILHNKDNGYAAQLADVKIRQLLWQPPIYRTQSIRQLVTHEAEEICTWGLQQKQQWVLRVEAALQHYIRRRGNTQYQQEREGMQRYLRQFQR
jgi:hypothetical protein